jgi:sugar phosphate isomerase/epimerase
VSSAAGAAAGGGANANMIGIQMYTVRDQLQTDFEGTVEKIARIGYRNLEFAGYYNRTPEQVRALLDRVGAVSRSSHIGAPLLRQDAAGQIKAAKTIGQEYITLPSYNFGNEGLAGWRKGVAEFNQWGRMCRDAGLKLAYHNHNREFAPLEGTSGYDVLVSETDPKLVDFELDLYWAKFADQDPLALFAKYPGRFAMWHVKDMAVTGTQKGMTPVGKGTIDFKSIFAHARQSGMKYFFVEHDTAAQYPGGSLASAQASYEYLHQLLTVA